MPASKAMRQRNRQGRIAPTFSVLLQYQVKTDPKEQREHGPCLATEDSHHYSPDKSALLIVSIPVELEILHHVDQEQPHQGKATQDINRCDTFRGRAIHASDTVREGSSCRFGFKAASH
jgi:hypothetical protein